LELKKMVDFSEILSKPAEEVKKSPPQPTGTYLAMIAGMPKQVTRQISGEDVNIISFNCKVISPGDDVDQEQLTAEGMEPIQSWAPLRQEFWLNTANGVDSLVKWLENTLDISRAKKSVGQMIAEAPGKQLYITLKHRPYQNKTTAEMEIAVDIAGTAKA
jgi:hypothetical protein